MFLTPTQAVDRLPLSSSARVADFGSGSGRHALLLSNRLGESGAVYALDIDDGHVESLAREKTYRGLSNLFSLRADLNESVPLRDGMLDAALVSNTLHALRKRDAFMRELNRVLAAGAAVMFVDWVHSFKDMGPAESDVVYPSDGVRLFESHGFAVGSMLPAGSHHYAFVATKNNG